MSAGCKTPQHAYEHDGESVRVWCELPPGHDGPHAAWTWEGASLPRVEWTDESPTAGGEQ